MRRPAVSRMRRSRSGEQFLEGCLVEDRGVKLALSFRKSVMKD
jgi:hypothetical protein